jgi:AbrB family looped-hinge helix DNA binding protein
MSPRGNDVVIRPKRQVTIPKDICDQLGIGPGDILELVVEESVLKATPKKRKALDALNEIRETFTRYGISEEELLKEARRTRREIAFERGNKKS